MTGKTIEREKMASERLTVETGTTGPAGDLRMTRRDLFAGIGQVVIAGMSVSSLALLGACATPQQEPWDDGTFWADATGWVD